MTPRELVSTTFIAVGAICVMAGRVATTHSTEMEALCEGWPFWVAGLVLMGIGLVVICWGRK